MKRPSVTFPYELRSSAVFGTTRRPVASVHLYSVTLQRWLACTMVVDTGADYCVLPSPLAMDLGLDFHRCKRYTTLGIGGRQPVFLYRGVRLRLGTWELRVPMGIVQRDDLPPLLGRYRCLDAFDLRLRDFVTTFSPLT